LDKRKNKRSKKIIPSVKQTKRGGDFSQNIREEEYIRIRISRCAAKIRRITQK
jgi:hypothetical protein